MYLKVHIQEKRCCDIRHMQILDPENSGKYFMQLFWTNLQKICILWKKTPILPILERISIHKAIKFLRSLNQVGDGFGRQVDYE